MIEIGDSVNVYKKYWDKQRETTYYKGLQVQALSTIYQKKYFIGKVTISGECITKGHYTLPVGKCYVFTIDDIVKRIKLK